MHLLQRPGSLVVIPNPVGHAPDGRRHTAHRGEADGARVPPDRRWVPQAAALVLLVAAFGWFLAGPVARITGLIHGDFPSFYFASKATFVHHGNPYDYQSLQDLARREGVRRAHPFVYLPASLPFFAPLPLMPYRTAQGAFLLVNIAGMFVLVALTMRAVLGVKLARPLCMVIMAYVLLFQPFHMLLESGQVNLVVACLLCGAWALLRRGRKEDLVAGLLLALAIVIKTYPAVFLAFLALRGRWGALGATIAWLLFLLAVGSAPLPDGTWRAWAESTAAHGGYGLAPENLYSPAACWNQSINGFTARLFLGDGFNEPLVRNVQAARLLPLVINLALLGVTVLACRASGNRNPRSFDLGFSAFLVFSFLAAPYSWEHHLVFILPPMALLLTRMLAAQRWTGGVLVFALVALFLAMPLPWSAPGFSKHPSFFRGAVPSVLISAKLAAVLAIWGLHLQQLWQGGEASP